MTPEGRAASRGRDVLPGRRAGVPGLPCQLAWPKLGASGRLRPRDVLVLTLTGHGLKDPDTAIANSEAAISIPSDAARLAAVLELG